MSQPADPASSPQYAPAPAHYIHSHEAQRKSQERSVPTVAAVQLRHGNSCRFPEWWLTPKSQLSFAHNGGSVAQPPWQQQQQQQWEPTNHAGQPHGNRRDRRLPVAAQQPSADAAALSSAGCGSSTADYIADASDAQSVALLHSGCWQTPKQAPRRVAGPAEAALEPAGGPQAPGARAADVRAHNIAGGLPATATSRATDQPHIWVPSGATSANLDAWLAQPAAPAAATAEITAAVGVASASTAVQQDTAERPQAHYDARSRNAADPGYEPATTTTPMQSPADVPSSAPPQLQGPPAAVPPGDTATLPADLPTDEAGMCARAQYILMLLGGPPMQQEHIQRALWQLRELAISSSCRAAMLAGGAVPILAALLADRGLPCKTHAYAAATLMRLGAEDARACKAIRRSGAFASLADMLCCRATPCREAAALALAFIGWGDIVARAAIFEAVADAGLRLYALRLGSGRCVVAYPADKMSEDTTPDSSSSSPFASKPSPLKGLAFMLASSRAADRRAAAALAHVLSARLPRAYAQRLAVHGSDVVPAMVALLGGRDPPSVHAAMSTLLNLCMAANRGNVPVVLEALVRGLVNGSLVARCRCAEALWRLARSGRAAPDALVIVQLQTRGAQLGMALVKLLVDKDLENNAGGDAGAMSVVGLTAAVTHDTPVGALLGSAVATHGGDPKVEELRLALLSSSGAMLYLAKLLRRGREWTRIVAAAALGHLAACRSDLKGSCPQLLAAAITLLNNLTADENIRRSVVNQLSMDKRNLQATRDRLLQCRSTTGLPDRLRHEARVVHTRLEHEPKFTTKLLLSCCAPLPPRPQPSFYDIWAGAANTSGRP